MRNSKSKFLSLRKVAISLGVDVSQLSKESKSRPGFPFKLVNGRKKFNAETVAKWRAQNIRPRARGDMPSSSAPMAATDANVIMLRSDTSSGVQLARAGAMLAARRLADGATAGSVGATTLNDLKAALENLRRAEAAALSLDVKRRQLIPVDEVQQVVGTMVGRLVRSFDQMETAVTMEIGQWLRDPKMQQMPADERSRTVREFVSKSGRQIRQMEAGGVQKLIDAESDAYEETDTQAEASK